MFKFEKLVFGDLGWGDEFLLAMLMTIVVSILSMGLGIFIAIFAAWAKLTSSKILKFISSFYTTVIRGIPELLVIYLIFFGGSALIMKSPLRICDPTEIRTPVPSIISVSDAEMSNSKEFPPIVSEWF